NATRFVDRTIFPPAEGLCTRRLGEHPAGCQGEKNQSIGSTSGAGDAMLLAAGSQFCLIFYSLKLGGASQSIRRRTKMTMRKVTGLGLYIIAISRFFLLRVAPIG